MPTTFAHSTSTAPDYEIDNIPGPDSASSPSAIPEGIRTWLPALVVLIAMPLLALTTTKYVLLPSFKQAFTPPAALPPQAAANLNISSMFLAKIQLSAPGARAGIRSIALIGDDGAFQDKVNQNKARLTGLAAADLAGVTTADLYKSNVLDAARARLLADFNHELGGPVVKELYIAVWPEK